MWRAYAECWDNTTPRHTVACLTRKDAQTAALALARQPQYARVWVECAQD